MRRGCGLVRRSAIGSLVVVLAAGPAAAATLRDAMVTTYLTSPQSGGGSLRAAAGRRIGSAGPVRLPPERVPERRSDRRAQYDPPGPDRTAEPVRQECQSHPPPEPLLRRRNAGAGQPGREPGAAPSERACTGSSSRHCWTPSTRTRPSTVTSRCSIWRSTTRSACSASSRPRGTGSRSARSRVPTWRRRKLDCRVPARTSSRPSPISPPRAPCTSG